MKQHIVEDGVYIPNEGKTFPDDPTTQLVKQTIVRHVDVEDPSYPFLNRSPGALIWRIVAYWIIFVPGRIMQRLRYGLRIEGKANLKKHKSELKNGALIVCNHVYRWDFMAIVEALNFRRLYVIVRADLVDGKDAHLIRGVGGIPIPKTAAAQRRFNQTLDKLHSEKKWICVFPEMCRWDFYEPLRPFRRGAFKIALRYNLPVLPLVISYRKPGKIRTALKWKHPLITIHVGEPVHGDSTGGKSKNEVAEKMRGEARAQMLRMAGIKQNCWD